MMSGMLFKGSLPSIADNILGAAEAYAKRYGVIPNKCFVSTMQEGDVPEQVIFIVREGSHTIMVRRADTVLLDRYFIGFDEKLTFVPERAP